MTIQRSNWYQLTAKLSLSEISEKLRESKYQQSDPFGFDLISIAGESVLAKYSEKFTHIDSYLNIYGDEVTSESIRYKIVKFSITEIHLNKYLIHVENTPRSSISMFSNLENTLKCDISLSPISIPIIDLLNTLTENPKIRQFKIKKAMFSGIAISTKSRARIEITSSQNALTDFNHKYKVEGYVVDKLNCHFRYNGEDVSLELRKTGSVSHSKKLTTLLNAELLNVAKKKH
ncbi:hypothetical protein [Shewanella baltica]|uniref:hypothetical protein n=1 Tax=Shewanella baltica TaxID=62322 RepID=UPI0039AF6321